MELDCSKTAAVNTSQSFVSLTTRKSPHRVYSINKRWFFFFTTAGEFGPIWCFLCVTDELTVSDPPPAATVRNHDEHAVTRIKYGRVVKEEEEEIKSCLSPGTIVHIFISTRVHSDELCTWRTTKIRWPGIRGAINIQTITNNNNRGPSFHQTNDMKIFYFISLVLNNKCRRRDNELAAIKYLD